MEYFLSILLLEYIPILSDQLAKAKAYANVIIPFLSVFLSDTFPTKSVIMVRGILT